MNFLVGDEVVVISDGAFVGCEFVVVSSNHTTVTVKQVHDNKQHTFNKEDVLHSNDCTIVMTARLMLPKR